MELMEEPMITRGKPCNISSGVLGVVPSIFVLNYWTNRSDTEENAITYVNIALIDED